VSSVSSTSSSTSTTLQNELNNGTLGDAAPVSFPGVASGIDYDSIIEKYTQATLEQEKPIESQVNNLTAANTEVLKIKNLIGSLQDSLTSLSNPNIFGAYKATVNNTSSGSPAATAKQIAGQQALAGTYTIDAQTAATSTQITNNAAANGALNTTVALDQAGTAITAVNGTTANGSITINGVQVNYDVTTQSLTTILNNIQAQVSGVTYTINAGGTVTLNGVTSLGSGADQGNLESVLKLDTAQLSAGTVTSSSTIAGINGASTLNADGNAGFATPVTSGTFTINGVQFSVNITQDSLNDIIGDINASSAGVTATYNTATSQIVLTNKTQGPQSILLGASGDTSNFLAAAGLSNGTTVAGTQASVTYTDAGGSHTVYSSTNDFSDVIPGFTLSVTQSSPTPATPGTAFYTVTVGSDPSQAETSINAFIKSYNAVINEINKATVAPQVSTSTSSAGLAQSTENSAGGILYGNFQISDLRDQLVQLVSGLVPTGSNSYNSLASVGLLLNTASQTVGTTDSDDTSSTSTTSDSDSDSSKSYSSTDGTLAALDTTTFEAAYAANTAAVQQLFTLTPPATTTSQAGYVYSSTQSAGISYQLGNYLSNVNGLTTFLDKSVVTPTDLNSVLLTNVLDSNNQQIDTLNAQINLVVQEANTQADQLRAQFTASETQIAELQALQSQIAAIGH
jgi:flagellar hook-associated protein 2